MSIKSLILLFIPFAKSAYIDLPQEEKLKLLLQLDHTNQQYFIRINKPAFDRSNKYLSEYYFSRFLLFTQTICQIYHYITTLPTNESIVFSNFLSPNVIKNCDSTESKISSCIFLVGAEAMPFIFGLDYNKQYLGEIARCFFLFLNTILRSKPNLFAELLINITSIGFSLLNLALLKQAQKYANYQDIFLLQDIQLANNLKLANQI